MNQYRIFTVEDDVDDRDFLKEAFAENGCAEELRHFFNYEALFKCLDVLPNEKLPHLVTFDNHLQDGNSRTAVETIKENCRLVNIKLALYSSCLQDRVKADSIQQGVNLCLEKGNTIKAIKEHVSRFHRLMEE